MMDAGKFARNSLTNLQIRIHQQENRTWIGYIEDPRKANYDDIGALYYVVAVVLIYGLSIVMMIASHIRKNKHDSQLRTYLKEMSALRKKDRREKIFEKLDKLAQYTHLTPQSKRKDKPKSSPRPPTRLAYHGSLKFKSSLFGWKEDVVNESLSRKSSSATSDSLFLMPDENKINDLTTRSANNTPRLKVKNPCHVIVMNDDTTIL